MAMTKRPIDQAIAEAPAGPGVYVLYGATGKQSRGLATNLKQRLTTHKRLSTRYGCPVTHAGFTHIPGATAAQLLAAEKKIRKGPGDVRELELARADGAAGRRRTHDVLLLGTTRTDAAAIARQRRFPRRPSFFAIGPQNRVVAAAVAAKAGGPPAIVAALVPVGVLDRLRRSGPGYLRPVPAEGTPSKWRWHAQPEAIDVINRHIDRIVLVPSAPQRRAGPR